MSYQDKTLTCVDCGTPFVFTSNEQAFYADRGFTNEPKRCPTCRQNRKAQQRGGQSYGNDGAAASFGGGYSSGSYGGGRSESSGGFGGGGRGREMHTVVCDGCGGEAHVPFVPRGDRPVYCSDCFSKQRGSGGGGGYTRAGRY
jgi:CxxC-x17-CxxC domain-containing protein